MSTCKKEVDLCITQGDEKAYNLTFKDGDGNAINITGSTVSFSAKARLSDTATVISKDVTNHTDPTNGKTTITLTTTDTNIDRGVYYYDIQIQGGGINRKTVVKGKLEITWQVTEG